MNKVVKSISILFLTFIFIFSNVAVIFADDYSNYDYVINNYDVSISVDENNVLYVSEDLDVFFNREKHGIVREIPEMNVAYRLDGTSTKAKVKVGNISVDNNYSIEKGGGVVSIRIGDPDTYVYGDVSYHITYTYDLRNDINENYDELYYNIIGNSWDAPIKNVSFSIAMPKDFDKSKIGFSSGNFGTLNSNDVEYIVENNVVYGKLNKSLMPYEAFTIRIELEDGYFDVNGFKMSVWFILSLIVPIASLIICFFLWKKYGKDDQVVETVEFYPPEGFNSLDVAYAYKGNANQNDVISLLIYLANKGYFNIIEKKKKDFTIEKIKEYDGNNSYERKFIDGLFKHNRNSVTKDELEGKFYKTIDNIIFSINNRQNKEKIYYSSSLKMGGLPFVGLILLTYLSIVCCPATMFGYMPSIIEFIFPFDAIGLVNIYLYVYLYGVACIIGMIVFQVLMPKRTEYGNRILGRIKGFKNFLEIAEKDKLEAMVNENPNYFYDILPYAYVLGVSNKWIKKFESIIMEEPHWYYGHNAFDLYYFNNFMNDTMRNAYMNVQNENSSGGMNTGGGFSGGGFGGGGGHSW